MKFESNFLGANLLFLKAILDLPIFMWEHVM